jgi:hypothetical protein
MTDSRLHEPVGDHREDFRVRLECIIKSRGIDEDNGITICRMRSSDGSNFCCTRLPTVTNNCAVLASSEFDEL